MAHTIKIRKKKKIQNNHFNRDYVGLKGLIHTFFEILFSGDFFLIVGGLITKIDG